MRLINFMIENMICMKQLSILDVIFNMLFVLTLILKLTTLDTSSKFHSLIKVLSSIFRDNNVISAIPSYFKNTESPIICYKYNRPIRNTILNFNKLVSDLDIVTSSPVLEIVKILNFVINQRVILSLVT